MKAGGAVAEPFRPGWRSIDAQNLVASEGGTTVGICDRLPHFPDGLRQPVAELSRPMSSVPLTARNGVISEQHPTRARVQQNPGGACLIEICPWAGCP
jgi:hypothetical protein